MKRVGLKGRAGDLEIYLVEGSQQVTGERQGGRCCSLKGRRGWEEEEEDGVSRAVDVFS